jgi:hypothetical protein
MNHLAVVDNLPAHKLLADTSRLAFHSLAAADRRRRGSAAVIVRHMLGLLNMIHHHHHLGRNCGWVRCLKPCRLEFLVRQICHGS